MSREIEAPYKPKSGDDVMFKAPDGTRYFGQIRKVLKGTNLVQIEANSGKWFEADVDEDEVKKMPGDQPASL